jgi:hypothetical protein
MRWMNWLLMGLVAALPVITGCAPSKSVGAVKATGTVTFDGKPLEGATVSFIPDGEGGRNAAGLTDAQGNFRLTTLEPGDGAMPGKYKVTVTKKDSDPNAYVPPASQEEGMKRAAAEAAKANSGFYKGVTPVKDLLPERYNSDKTSGLSAEVKSGGDNNFTFPLTTSG